MSPLCLTSSLAILTSLLMTSSLVGSSPLDCSSGDGWEVQCQGSTLRVDCCAKQAVTWYRSANHRSAYSSEKIPVPIFANHNATDLIAKGLWTQVDTESDGRIVQYNKGQRLVISNTVMNDSGLYHCVSGDKYQRTKNVTVFDCGTRGQVVEITYPPPERVVTYYRVGLGQNVTLTCRVFSSGSRPVSRFLWYQKPNMTTSGLTSRRIGSLNGEHIKTPIRTIKPGYAEQKIHVINMVKENYQKPYICRAGRRGKRFFILSPISSLTTVINPVIAPPPKTEFSVIPILAPILVAFLLISIASFHTDLRYHMANAFRKVSEDERDKRILIVNSESERDVRFINQNLVPKLQTSWGHALVINYRDYFIGNYEQETIDQLKTVSRVIFVVTNDFMRDRRCTKAYEAALGEDTELIFLVVDREALEDNSAVICNPTVVNEEIIDVNITNPALTERIRKAGGFFAAHHKLEWISRDLTTEGRPTLVLSLAKLRRKREIDIFWKKMSLALPRIRNVRPRDQGHENIDIQV